MLESERRRSSSGQLRTIEVHRFWFSTETPRGCRGRGPQPSAPWEPCAPVISSRTAPRTGSLASHGVYGFGGAFHSVADAILGKRNEAEEEADTCWADRIERKRRDLYSLLVKACRVVFVVCPVIQEACEIHSAVGVREGERQPEFRRGLDERLETRPVFAATTSDVAVEYSGGDEFSERGLVDQGPWSSSTPRSATNPSTNGAGKTT